MKVKANTVRIKLILAFLLSALFSGICILVLFLSVSIAYYYNPEVFFTWVNTHVVLLFFISLLIFILLMSMFFLRLIQKGMKHLENITEQVEEISKGKLGIQMQIDRNDELGKLSNAVNTMSSELKRLIEEEQNWEKAKDDMVSNISHDLKTPLTSMLGYLQLIIDYQQNDNEEYALQYANTAYSKCMDLKLLIDQLFEYAKVSNREYKLNSSKIDIAELIKQVVSGMMPEIQKSGLNCRTNFPDERLYIFADAALMARMFDNLINNAVKYGVNGEYIDIELKNDTIDAIVTITNYGITIPEADLPYIFDRFYCVDKSRTSSNTGAGLGLAIVKNITEKHSGKISVASSNNKTMFEFRMKLYT